MQRYLTAIRTYFTRWLIRTNSYDLTRTILYDLSKPQWRVGLGAGVRCRSSVQIHTNWQLVKYVRFSKNRMNLYEWGRMNSYELATLVKYVRIAVRSGCNKTQDNTSKVTPLGSIFQTVRVEISDAKFENVFMTCQKYEKLLKFS